MNRKSFAVAAFASVIASACSVNASKSTSWGKENVSKLDYQADTLLFERGDNKEVQLDLFLDYASNVKLYPTFQTFFREFKPPTLAIWGKHDPFFIPPGAEAYRRDNPNVTVEMLDTGHFALETHVDEIAIAIDRLLRPVAAK